MGKEARGEGKTVNLTVQASPNTRVNGPALLLSCHKDADGSNDCMLMMPMTGFDEVTLQAVWQMADPTHEAKLAMFQTLDWDTTTANWIPLDTLLLPTEREWFTSNQMSIHLPRICCQYLGVKLMARSPSGPIPPGKARFDGRIWTTLAGHQDPPPITKVYGSGNGPHILVIGEEGREEFLAELLGVSPEELRGER